MPVTIVRLNNTQVTDAKLKELAGLKQLKTLYLHDTRVAGEVLGLLIVFEFALPLLARRSRTCFSSTVQRSEGPSLEP